MTFLAVIRISMPDGKRFLRASRSFIVTTLFLMVKIGSATELLMRFAVGCCRLLSSFGPPLVHGSGLADCIQK